MAAHARLNNDLHANATRAEISGTDSNEDYLSTGKNNLAARLFSLLKTYLTVKIDYNF